MGWTWDEVVSNAVVVDERDKVRDHSRDDYGLGPGWVFGGGKHLRLGADGLKDEEGRSCWVTLWILPTTEFRNAVEPRLIEGLGGLSFRGWTDGWRVIASSRVHIGSDIYQLEEPPPRLLRQFMNGA